MPRACNQVREDITEAALRIAWFHPLQVLNASPSSPKKDPWDKAPFESSDAVLECLRTLRKAGIRRVRITD